MAFTGMTGAPLEPDGDHRHVVCDPQGVVGSSGDLVEAKPGNTHVPYHGANGLLLCCLSLLAALRTALRNEAEGMFNT